MQGAEERVASAYCSSCSHLSCQPLCFDVRAQAVRFSCASHIDCAENDRKLGIPCTVPWASPGTRHRTLREGNPRTDGQEVPKRAPRAGEVGAEEASARTGLDRPVGRVIPTPLLGLLPFGFIPGSL